MVYSQVLSKEIQQAHGITTAAGNWLAAAVGCGCGGGMNAMATVTVALVCIMMRFGPRNSDLVLVQADLTTSVPEGAEIQAAEISLQPPSPPFAMKFLE